MGREMMKNRVKEFLRVPVEELTYLLPSTINDIHKYGVKKALDEVPDLLSIIMARLVEIDAAKFLEDNPEYSNKFMDLLWEGINILAVKSEEFRGILERIRPVNVNFEASDSPLRGHFSISQGKLCGGSRLLHFKDQDFRYLGPTAALIGLLSGKQTQRFGRPEVRTEGHPALVPLIAPIIQGISKLTKGKQ